MPSARWRRLNTSAIRGPTYDVSDAIETVERVVVAREELTVCLVPFGDPADNDAATQIRIPWTVRASNPDGNVDSGENVSARDEGLLQSIVRAHAWNQSFLTGTHGSVEKLAKANGLHPKVVRQALRLAFLSPEVTSAILEGGQMALDGDLARSVQDRNRSHYDRSHTPRPPSWVNLPDNTWP
jgi:hypothetical protein